LTERACWVLILVTVGVVLGWQDKLAFNLCKRSGWEKRTSLVCSM